MMNLLKKCKRLHYLKAQQINKKLYKFQNRNMIFLFFFNKIMQTIAHSKNFINFTKILLVSK